MSGNPISREGYFGDNPLPASKFWDLLGLGSVPHQGRALMAEGTCSTFTLTPNGGGMRGGAKIVVDGGLTLELDHVDVQKLRDALAVCGDMAPGQVTFSLIFPREKQE
ncbi:hypothetical protein FF47_66 [Mycobacterium phage FF47]|uniref:Uncharacterized protein n=2 Tax=Mapvirus Ff47 TaxID=1920751 RepID=M4W8J3_9CAUD|nr:hypothetical protein FF47_66 [Mycobacterium phage FF47]AGI12338.1 hypothetical protein FF47_66 [Mycobacterium phage FF47]